MKPLFFLLLPCSVLAQQSLYFDPTIPVTEQGAPLHLAWAGGANSIQMGSIDLDGDGIKDLLLFDRAGNKVITLLNNGGPGLGTYSVTRQFDDVYPFKQLHDWALLYDYNCDGKEDIMSYSQAGFSVYRNTSEGGQLSFEMTTFRVNSNYVSSNGNPVIANLYISQVDLPAFTDVDSDGDMDVLTFSLLGSYVEYHKNLSQETYGHCDSLIYEVKNKCWGFFAENFSNNSVSLNVPCSFNVPAPEMPAEPGRPVFIEPAGDRAHAGSSLLSIDLDGSGTKDLLLGDISFNNLVGLYNGGTITSSLMTAEDTLFPSYDLSVDLPIFPGAFYVDVDNDGLKDLVASPNTTSLAQNFRSMWFYKNTNTNDHPQFDFQMENVLQNKMIDLGEGAYPVPFDENGDGLMDIIVANHGYFMPGNIYQGQFALFRNVGTMDSPAFDLVASDHMGLSSLQMQSMYPAFGDIDGDGDKDMYIGDLQGRLHFFRNNATGPIAQFQLIQANILDASGQILDVGQYAAPQLYDLDEDGLLDLVIGERNGNLNYYRNTGTATTPQWTLITENLGEVSTVEWWNITGHSTPFLFENSDGGKEILLGSESGWIYHYGGIDGNLAGAWSLIDSTYLDIYEGHRTALLLHDFNNDGMHDMVIGNARGGLSYWSSDPNISTGEITEKPLAEMFTVSPNPATDQLLITLKEPIGGKANWQLVNGLGQIVEQVPIDGMRTFLSLDGIEAGAYIVRSDDPAMPATHRTIVIR